MKKVSLLKVGGYSGEDHLASVWWGFEPQPGVRCQNPRCRSPQRKDAKWTQPEHAHKIRELVTKGHRASSGALAAARGREHSGLGGRKQGGKEPCASSVALRNHATQKQERNTVTAGTAHRKHRRPKEK